LANKEYAMPNQEESKDGLTSDRQPDLVAPSGVNERDHGAADPAEVLSDRNGPSAPSNKRK